MTRTHLLWICTIIFVLVVAMASCGGEETVVEDGGGTTINATFIGTLEGNDIYYFTNRGDACYVIEPSVGASSPGISCNFD